MAETELAGLDIEEVMRNLPHRYPFLLVDRVVSMDSNSIVAIKNVTYNEPYFLGHFPPKPVMPGVLIVEALAQTSGIFIFTSADKKPDFSKSELFYLTGIDNARFKRMVVPGDQLQLNVTFERERRGLWKFIGEATVDGELACSAEFMNYKGY